MFVVFFHEIFSYLTCQNRKCLGHESLVTCAMHFHSMFFSFVMVFKCKVLNSAVDGSVFVLFCGENKFEEA